MLSEISSTGPQMKTLYLHVGRGQTGTTIIQRYLTQKRAELRTQGVHYISADDSRGIGHQEFAKSFMSDRPSFMIPPNEPDQVRHQIAEEICLSDCPIILLSSEHLVVGDVRHIFDYFQGLPCDIATKIIFFVRSQDETAESEYNKVVKSAGETRSLEDYVRCALTSCDYYEIANEWAHFFGHKNIICDIYDGRKNAVIEQFLGCIKEISIDQLSPFVFEQQPDAANRSIGIRALTIVRLLNGLEIDPRRQFYNLILSQLSGNDIPALMFDSAQARKFRERYAASNRNFTRNFMGHAQDDLGGRRYSDRERDHVRQLITELSLTDIDRRI